MEWSNEWMAGWMNEWLAESTAMMSMKNVLAKDDHGDRQHWLLLLSDCSVCLVQISGGSSTHSFFYSHDYDVSWLLKSSDTSRWDSLTRRTPNSLWWSWWLNWCCRLYFCCRIPFLAMVPQSRQLDSAFLPDCLAGYKRNIFMIIQCAASSSFCVDSLLSANNEFIFFRCVGFLHDYLLWENGKGREREGDDDEETDVNYYYSPKQAIFISRVRVCEFLSPPDHDVHSFLRVRGRRNHHLWMTFSLSLSLSLSRAIRYFPPQEITNP